MEKRHTYNMGLIGNCSYLSYIDQSANVVWHCWPKFDSSFIFGGLLDKEKGGYFYVQPVEPFESKQYYLENTNVLCTEFTSSEGRFRVLDYAPRFEEYGRHFKPLMFFRKIEKLEGSPRVKVGCQPRSEYGEVKADVSYGSNHIRYLGLGEQVRLTTNIPLNYVANESAFLLSETSYLALTWGVPLEAPLKSTAESFLERTIDYWRTWVEHCSIPDVYQSAVIRSSLVLKLHQYEDTGAIIASGTTSLPEAPGSGRNWDYRFFWVRDTFYTLKAFNLLGHFEELGRYSHFLQNIVSQKQDRYPPVYSILGANEIDESILNLAGYLENQPVRIGNAARHQIQNDIYGQMILSLLPLFIDRRIIKRRRLESSELVHKVLEYIDQTMDEADSGLWELRTSRKRHCYTYLFHWAGSAAAVKIGEALKDEDLVRKAKSLMEQSAQNIEKCYNPQTKSYTSYNGAEFHDASLFQLVTMNYLPPGSQRAHDHVAAMERELMANGGLFYRYVHNDDFGKPEVAFLVCGFWYVSALTKLGRQDDAIKAFEQLLGCGNHLGLLSEDVDPVNNSQWGNFVQTYSHVGVINAAFDISRNLNKPNFL